MKRSFGGQMTLTVCLIFLILILFSTAGQLSYRRLTVDLMAEDVTASAAAASSMVEFLGNDGSRGRQQLCVQLNYTARSTGNDTVVCDESGTIVTCSCGLQSCEHLGYQFSHELLDRARSGQTVFLPEQEIGCYGEKRMAAVCLSKNLAGAVQYVVSSRSYTAVNQRLADAVRVNVLVVILVMLLSVPLVWAIVQRQMKPIKQMTSAARKMAHGQMDVRVDVDDTDTAELNELALAFNNMAQALAKSEQKRQEFVANVSHELKTPMTTISGYMEGMLDGTIPKDQQPKYMEIISQEVKRLSRLVRSMLEISRIQDQGIPQERRRAFDLCQTVGEVLLSFEQKINGKHLEVETDLPDQGAKALADPDAITQVVYNLIDNAVKFCPEGGTLGLGVAQTKGGKYLVSVRNTGPTIPAEELPLVFDRFHKTDKSRSVDRDGWGLGLYIVKTIILGHEEDIYVTSREGVTEFSFTLPRVNPNG
ncbi:MAG: HAMP domain-containing histidine kinase [Oscillospiraceae bacterium]|nr:HAMP domain-containing histidine kinase [Oscillospiraceae bacterium]